MIIVVMGVSGCGKTTVGELLAERLRLPFVDADYYHSAISIQKMKSGIPLTDEDRFPWLHTLASLLLQYEKTGVVLACSALKASYRSILQKNLTTEIIWLYLDGSYSLLHERLQNRTAHFMPERLLESQLQILEVPADAFTFSITLTPGEIVEGFVKQICSNS
jgi:carbohydrate kinase (thermoresistant glucokinase family)